MKKNAHFKKGRIVFFLFCLLMIGNFAWGQKQSVFTIGTTTAPATPTGQQLTANANSYVVAGNTATTYLNVIINNAIVAGYRNFFIQEGTYYLGGSINLDTTIKRGVKITGSGKNTILRPAAAASLFETMFLFQNSENNSISDLTIELSSISNSLSLKAKRAFYLKNGGQRNIFDNIYIGSENYQTTATANTATSTNLVAIELEGKIGLDVDYNTFSNIYFRKFDNCVRFNVETTVSHNIFDNFHLEAFKIGVDFVGKTNLCNGNFFTDWDIQASGAGKSQSNTFVPSYSTNIIKDIKGAHNTFRNFTVADWQPYSAGTIDANGNIINPTIGSGYYMFNISDGAERTVIENTDAETNNHFPNVTKSGDKPGWYLDNGVGTQFFNNASFNRVTDYIGYNVNEMIYRGQNKSLLDPLTATIADVHNSKHNNLRFENFGRVRFSGNTALFGKDNDSNLAPDFHVAGFKRIRLGGHTGESMPYQTSTHILGEMRFQPHVSGLWNHQAAPTGIGNYYIQPVLNPAPIVSVPTPLCVITNRDHNGTFQWTKVSDLLSASSWNHIAFQNIKMNNFAIVNNPAVPDPENAPGIRLDNNGNVRVGTQAPVTINTPKMQVDGEVYAEILTSTNGSVPNNSVAANFLTNEEQFKKSLALNVGALLDNQDGFPAAARTLKLLDFPKSNFRDKPVFHFALEDRNNSNRFRFVAETGGYSSFVLSDYQQKPYLVIGEGPTPGGAIFSHASLLKPITSLTIGASWGTIPSNQQSNYKLVLKYGESGEYVRPGSLYADNNVVAMGAIGIGTEIFSYSTDVTTSNDGIYKLAVNGKIRGTGLRLTTQYWSDFVFAKDYKLPSLQEVEQHIVEKGHLPNIPSEKEMIEKGLDVVEMAKLQMQKIEELTLYIIVQNKKIEVLESKVNALQTKK